MPASFSWHTPPETLALEDGEIHLWRAALSHPTARIESLLRILTADEIDRAERYYFQKDRQHFIAARGLLRRILSLYLDVEPVRLRFRYNKYGKPMLADDFAGNTLCFNVAHSHELALYAVTRGRDVGVDVEFLRAGIERGEMVERSFSRQEVSALRKQPDYKQTETFFTYWTLKEAYIKARGEGLSYPLNQFSVSLSGPAARVEVCGDPQESARWSFIKLSPHPDYAAAIAVEGDDWQLKCWHWSE